MKRANGCHPIRSNRVKRETNSKRHKYISIETQFEIENPIKADWSCETISQFFPIGLWLDSIRFLILSSSNDKFTVRQSRIKPHTHTILVWRQIGSFSLASNIWFGTSYRPIDQDRNLNWHTRWFALYESHRTWTHTHTDTETHIDTLENGSEWMNRCLLFISMNKFANFRLDKERLWCESLPFSYAP